MLLDKRFTDPVEVGLCGSLLHLPLHGFHNAQGKYHTEVPNVEVLGQVWCTKWWITIFLVLERKIARGLLAIWRHSEIR